MVEVYPLGLCSEVNLDKQKITVVGNVEGTFDRGVIISDSTGKCKVLNVPRNISGLIEVWGEVNRNFEVEVKGFTTFTDSNFDFDSHKQIVEYLRKFQDLS